MSHGGGEILRAMIESDSVYSTPAFYCMVLNGNDGTHNAFATQRGFLQCHKDKWFLMTAMVPTATAGDDAGSVGYERIDQPEFIRIFDPNTNQNFALNPPTSPQIQASLYAESNIANSFTFPTYILWEPASLIGLEWVGRNTFGTPNWKFLTLLGIEYGLKG